MDDTAVVDAGVAADVAPADGGVAADEAGEVHTGEELVQTEQFGELENYVRRSSTGAVIASDSVVNADDATQLAAFREVMRSVLTRVRGEVEELRPAAYFERSAEAEDDNAAADRADQLWTRAYDNFVSDTGDAAPAASDPRWDNSVAKRVLTAFHDLTSVVSPDESFAQGVAHSPVTRHVDNSWVHKEEAEIAKSLNGPLAGDRKRNTVLQRLSQAGNTLAPKSAGELARATVAAAAAAETLGDGAFAAVGRKSDRSTLSDRSVERQEMDLLSFVKMDPEQSLQQLGLTVRSLNMRENADEVDESAAAAAASASPTPTDAVHVDDVGEDDGQSKHVTIVAS